MTQPTFDEAEYGDYMHGLMSEICDEIGPREAGSVAEYAAKDRLIDEFEQYTERVESESFQLRNRAYLYWIRVCLLLTFIAFATHFLEYYFADRFPFFIEIGGLLMVVAFLIMYFEFFANREVLEKTRLWEEKTSHNVIADLGAAASDATRTAIFSAHYDSAFILRFIQNWPDKMSFLVTSGFVGMALIFGATVVYTLWKLLARFGIVAPSLFGVETPFIFLLVSSSLLATLPFLIINWFQVKYEPVPGASDNLSGIVVLTALARLLNADGYDAALAAAGIRVRLIAFGAEETGIRGSKRYARRHAEELRDADTVNINLDGIAEEDAFVLIENEKLTGISYCETLNRQLTDAGETHGIHFDRQNLRIGQTDAASFIRVGVPATTVIATPQEPVPHYYHTLRDTPDVVQTAALTKGLRICAQWLEDRRVE